MINIRLRKSLVFSLMGICVLVTLCLFGSYKINTDQNVEQTLNRKVRETELDASGNTSQHTHETNNEHEIVRYHVAQTNWSRVSTPYIIALWIIFAGVAKMAFHFIHKVVSRVPESCILICLGLVVGGVAYAIDKNQRIEQLLFNPDTFFLFILPPIVMEAGYFMPKEPFFENIGTILTYAIVGTIFNALAIGASLYGVFIAGWMPGIEKFGGDLTLLQCLLFGSIISAVDPVAVISVFEEIHVNTVLYICVFGESLLNDGVAVVLFKMFESYIEIGQENILPIDIVAGISSFFVVAFGALFIGIVFGYIGAFVTKYTVHNRIIEPTFVFLFCYMSYLTAELFHLSGIIAIVFAAFTMSGYVEHNISHKSHTTVKYGMKMLANIAETIIFMLLGIAAVSDFWQYWNTGFVLWTLFFITIYRGIGVYTLTAAVNYVRLDKINTVDQFVMAYGGLRGAIAFSLVSLTSADLVPAIKTMICACIVAILFTSFIQGSTIRPIVEFLKVKTADKHTKTMFEDINIRMIDHVMAGIEDVTGHHGHHYWMQRLHEINAKYLQPLFVREPYKTRHAEILDTFHRINKRAAEDLVLEYERGNSSSDLTQNATFANLLLPYDMRRSQSQASFNCLFRQHAEPGACIDMNAMNMKPSEATKSLEAADVHHLLEQNMYKPRTREKTRHRRGNIDEDDDRKKQEQEIMLRHKINLQYQRKHYKHRHNRHKSRASSKSPLAMSSSKSGLKANNSVPTFCVEPAKEETKHQEKPHEDEGITFSADTITPGQQEEQTDGADFDTVALDRELPWKRNLGVAVSDPQTSLDDGRSQQPISSESIELWPRRNDGESGTKDTDEAKKVNLDDLVEDVV